MERLGDLFLGRYPITEQEDKFLRETCHLQRGHTGREGVFDARFIQGVNNAPLLFDLLCRASEQARFYARFAGNVALLTYIESAVILLLLQNGAERHDRVCRQQSSARFESAAKGVGLDERGLAEVERSANS